MLLREHTERSFSSTDLFKFTEAENLALPQNHSGELLETQLPGYVFKNLSKGFLHNQFTNWLFGVLTYLTGIYFGAESTAVGREGWRE